MKKENYSYSFTTTKTPTEVFKVLQDIKQWWSGLYNETIKGKSDTLNDEFTFMAGEGVHYSKQKLVTLQPDKKIAWLVTESNLNFLKKTDEWNDTRIQFDLAKDANGTKVTFTHEGLVPQIECYSDCSSAWSGYLGNLKKRLV